LLTVMTIDLVANPAWATTFTVNSTGNDGDTTLDGTCDSDPTAATVTCTLREAIQEANANDNAPTVDAIDFNISGAGAHTISPTGSDLPSITEAVTIDGYSPTLFPTLRTSARSRSSRSS
jgi:CSLREA domain-containing protein